jgi:lactose/L-arabinose transport system permease protein
MNINKQRTREGISFITVHAVLIIGAIISIGPLYWVVKSSFTPLADIFKYPPELLPLTFSVDSYPRLLAAVPFFRNIFNSLFIATIYTTLTVLLSSMVGFGFSRYRKAPGANILFIIVLASIMVPFQTVAISLFVYIAKLGWVNTYQGVIIPLIANGFSAFMMTQFMMGFPDEVLDAARIDGCNDLRAFWAVVMPVMRPAVGAVAVLQFVHSLNDFFWPLLVLSEKKMYTIPVVMGSFAVQQAVVPYDIIAAGITLATVPMVIAFIFAQKQFISGLTMGATKG